MRNTTRRTILLFGISAALCAFGVWSARGLAVGGGGAAEKAIKKDDARKLIAAASLLELNKEAVTIRDISPPGVNATVLASVKLGFRFERDARGIWRVVEVRTGDRRWESFDLLARAGGEAITTARAELDALAAELDALADKKGTAAGDAPASQPGGNDKQAAPGDKNEPPKELRRGALTVRNPAAALAPTGSTVVVELEVETSVDFVRDARGRWQVARMRVGGRSLEAFDAFERALDTEKRARARAELESLAAALEAHRRARGFYVVAATATDLVDHLNPRYTSAFIRFDPWHRPYEYEGTRERFTLRSLGADGKANTADDVTLGK